MRQILRLAPLKMEAVACESAQTDLPVFSLHRPFKSQFLLKLLNDTAVKTETVNTRNLN